MWYGLSMGLTRTETLYLPFGELLDLIAIEQIKREGARPRRVCAPDEEIIPDVR